MYDMGTIRLVWPTPSETTRGTSFINYLMHFLSPFDRDWLVGLLEADGSFLCTRSPHTSKIQLAIKLTQHPSNIRALVAVKKLLRTGKIEHILSANTRICGAQRDKRSTSFRGKQAMLRTRFCGAQREKLRTERKPLNRVLVERQWKRLEDCCTDDGKPTSHATKRA